MARSLPELILYAIVGASLAYTLAAGWLVGRLRAETSPPADAPPVTLLKPLHGPEPRLRENLASFLVQDYPGPVQMLCGVSDPDDPAGAVARSLGAEVAVSPRRIGANGKVSNLAGMMPHAAHDLLVLSDSDMSVPAHYLAAVARAFDGAAGAVGAVTCLYRGRGDAGGWSRLAAAGISYHFLPSVVMGVALGLARPCMGSTIALRRGTLAAIGGFARFADRLADDFEIGRAVRALGLEIVIPRLVLTHGCTDASLAALLRHELRWAATVRRVDPAGYAGSFVTHPLPLALVAGLLLGGIAWWTVPAAFAARSWLMWRVDGIVGEASAPLWMLPARDLLSAVTFVGGLFARRLEWRGEALAVDAKGRMEPSR